MMMLKLYDFDDYEKLPLTKWHIKQPNANDVHRENPMLTGNTFANPSVLLIQY